MTERAQLIWQINCYQTDAAWYADRAMRLRELGFLGSARELQQRAACNSAVARELFITLTGDK